MSKLPNGPYFYRVVENSIPIVVEILHGWVYEVGDSHERPVSSYAGTFTRLTEITPEQIAAIDDALDVAGEAAPYAGDYFNKKWQLSERYMAAEVTLRPLLDAAIAATVSAALESPLGAKGESE